MDSDTHKLDPQEPARLIGNGPSTPTPTVQVGPGWPAPPLPESPGANVPPAAPAPNPATGGYGPYPSQNVAPRPVAPGLFGGSVRLPWIVIGLGLLFLLGGGNLAGVFGSAIVLAVGLVFLYVYRAQGRNFGFLVPGAILTGLGSGIVLATLGLGGGWVPLGLGLGFCAIWYLYRAHWWALIPGVITGLAGLSALAGEASPWRGGWGWHMGSFHSAWPLLLVVFGFWLVFGRRRWRRW